MNKAQLQEKALQLDVEVLDDEGKELTVAVLEKAIKARESELAKEKAEEDRLKAEAAAEKAKAEKAEKAANKKAAAPIQIEPSMPDPAILKAYGVSVSKRDIALSRKYGYNVAVPQARVFVTSAGFCSAIDKEHRPAGSTVLCAPFEIANKVEYLTEVTEEE